VNADEPRSHPELGWLAAVLPADARRIRARDPLLARSLALAGADVTERHPEVEVGPAHQMAGDAALAVVPIASLATLAGSRPRRLARRLAASLAVRVRAARATRILRRRGYRPVERLPWDIEQPLRLPGAAGPRRRLVERLPRAIVVTGRRAEVGPTIARRAVDEAGRRAGTRLAVGAPLVTGGGSLVLFAPHHVVRVAVGPARQALSNHRAPLAELHARRPPSLVARRLPRPLAHGHGGLGSWALEDRLPGAAPPAVDETLRAQCVEFLVSLHGCGGGSPAVPLTDAADVIQALGGESRAGLTELAARLDDDLAALPRGFAHGDFWRKNLLVEHERLVGVVDWEHAGAGRLPLLDLLQLASAELGEGRSVTSVVVGDLLGWARAGGDATARAYCSRLGFEASPPVLERLVLAFWLDRIGRQLAKCGDVGGTPRWVGDNVDPVLLAAGVERDGALAGRGARRRGWG
jgi:hypothetical protein